MTIQSELFLATTSKGLKVLHANQKSTLFTKAVINETTEILIRQAILNKDAECLAFVVASLLQAVKDGGWEKAPGAYCLKHNGFMIGRGLYTPAGIKSDLLLTVRTSSSLF